MAGAGGWMRDKRFLPQRFSHSILMLLSVTLMLCQSGVLSAQELEPRAYSNTQTGVNLLGVGLGYSEGNILLDPALPIEGLKGDLTESVAVRHKRVRALPDGAACDSHPT